MVNEPERRTDSAALASEWMVDVVLSQAVGKTEVSSRRGT